MDSRSHLTGGTRCQPSWWVLSYVGNDPLWTSSFIICEKYHSRWVARTKFATEQSPTFSSSLFPFLGQLGRCLGSKRDRRWELSLSFPHPCPRLGEALCLLSNLLFSWEPLLAFPEVSLCVQPGLPPRAPRTPCGCVGPQPRLPASYLLLGSAELLLHLLGEEAGSAARPALGHPANSPGGGLPWPGALWFSRGPQRRKCVPVMPRIRPGGPRAGHPAPLPPGNHPGPPEAPGPR